MNIFVILFFVFVGLIVFFIFKIIKSSSDFSSAHTQVKQAPVDNLDLKHGSEYIEQHEKIGNKSTFATKKILIISIICLVAVGSVIGYLRYQNVVRANNSVRITQVTSDKDGWTIKGTTKAPDGSVIAVLNNQNKQISSNPDKGGVSYVKNGEFKTYVSTLSDMEDLKNKSNAKVKIATIPYVSLKDNERDIKKSAVRSVNENAKIVKLDVTNSQVDQYNGD